MAKGTKRVDSGLPLAIFLSLLLAFTRPSLSPPPRSLAAVVSLPCHSPFPLFCPRVSGSTLYEAEAAAARAERKVATAGQGSLRYRRGRMKQYGVSPFHTEHKLILSPTLHSLEGEDDEMVLI